MPKSRKAVAGPEDTRREAIADIIQTVQRIVRATYQFTRKGLRESGAGGPQVWALITLAEAGEITVGDLADRMYLHISTVSALVDRMVTHGWVERERSETDRRVVHVRISAAGREVLARSDMPPRARLPHGLEDLPERTLLETRRAFLRVGKIMGLGETAAEPEA